MKSDLAWFIIGFALGFLTWKITDWIEKRRVFKKLIRRMRRNED